MQLVLSSALFSGPKVLHPLASWRVPLSCVPSLGTAAAKRDFYKSSSSPGTAHVQWLVNPLLWRSGLPPVSRQDNSKGSCQLKGARGSAEANFGGCQSCCLLSFPVRSPYNFLSRNLHLNASSQGADLRQSSSFTSHHGSLKIQITQLAKMATN